MGLSGAHLGEWESRYALVKGPRDRRLKASCDARGGSRPSGLTLRQATTYGKERASRDEAETSCFSCSRYSTLHSSQRESTIEQYALRLLPSADIYRGTPWVSWSNALR